MDTFRGAYCQGQPSQVVSDLPISPELFPDESGHLSADISLKQIPMAMSQFEEAEPYYPENMSTEPSTPYSAYRFDSCSFFPPTYPSSTEWNPSATPPSMFDSPRYVNQSCNFLPRESSLDYVSPPSLSTTSQDSRPRTCADSLESFPSVPSSSPYLSQQQKRGSYYLECSTSSSQSVNEQKYSDGLRLAPKMQHLPSDRAGPQVTSVSPDISWPLSPSRSPSSIYEDVTSTEPENEENPTDKPYAKLIWQAMMETPHKRMTLRQIYDWFKQNTTKPSDSGTNGWQNSIRHNLSMNQAFESEKADPSGLKHSSKKSNNVWVLTARAIENGVESTTRYRNKGNVKKTSKSKLPAPQRQQSGAKGGRAARRAAKQRQIELDRSAPIKKDSMTRFEGSASTCGKFSIPRSPVTPVLEEAVHYAAPTDHALPSNLLPDQSTYQTGINAGSTGPTSFAENLEGSWRNDPWSADWLSMEQLQQQNWDGLKHLNS